MDVESVDVSEKRTHDGRCPGTHVFRRQTREMSGNNITSEQCDFRFDLFLVLVLVLALVFQLFFSFSFVLVFIIFRFSFSFSFANYCLVLVSF